MNKKLSIKETMKPVIGAIREGNKSWSDLKKLKPQSREIPDKTLARWLEYLEYWNLVKQEGNFWVWYENVRVFGSREYDLAIEHSRTLLPAFQQMLEEAIIFRDPRIFSAAKDHLKSYPEIYRRLEKFEKEFAQLNKKLFQNKEHLQKYYNVDLGGPFRFIAFYDSWNPTTPEEMEMKDNLGGPELKNFLEIYRELSGHISLLKLKIEHGQPLEGMCILCPKVKVMKEAEKAE